MIFALFEGYIIYSDGKTTVYLSQITWAIAFLALAWIVWYLVSEFLRARRLKRAPRNVDVKTLRKIVKIKNELTMR